LEVLWWLIAAVCGAAGLLFLSMLGRLKHRRQELIRRSWEIAERDRQIRSALEAAPDKAKVWAGSERSAATPTAVAEPEVVAVAD
jgi:hypothetical protein